MFRGLGVWAFRVLGVGLFTGLGALGFGVESLGVQVRILGFFPYPY